MGKLTLNNPFGDLASFRDNDTILKASRQKEQVIYKGKVIRLASRFPKPTYEENKAAMELFLL